MSFTKETIPYCIADGFGGGHIRVLIAFVFLSYVYGFSAPLYIGYRHEKAHNYDKKRTLIGKFSIFSAISVLFRLFLLGITFTFQRTFMMSRPESDCVPFFMSEYGLPSTEIVGVSSTSITILITYVMHYYFNMKKRKTIDTNFKMIHHSIPDDNSEFITIITKIIDWIYTIVQIGSLMFFCFVHPFVYYIFQLNTLNQIIISIIWGTVPTIVFWGFVIFNSKDQLL